MRNRKVLMRSTLSSPIMATTWSLLASRLLRGFSSSTLQKGILTFQEVFYQLETLVPQFVLNELGEQDLPVGTHGSIVIEDAVHEGKLFGLDFVGGDLLLVLDAGGPPLLLLGGGESGGGVVLVVGLQVLGHDADLLLVFVQFVGGVQQGVSLLLPPGQGVLLLLQQLLLPPLLEVDALLLSHLLGRLDALRDLFEVEF